MAPLLINLALAALGVVGILCGILTWRHADRITQDARRTLTDMFEAQMPEVFTEPSSPRGAQGAGIGFAALGVALIVVAIVAAVTGFSWG
jgi:hypothetical protein